MECEADMHKEVSGVLWLRLNNASPLATLRVNPNAIIQPSSRWKRIALERAQAM
jgi:hypothetical protein